MAASYDEMLAPARVAETVSVFSTDAVPPRQRTAYWHESVLRRLDAKPCHEDKRPFQARLMRLSGEGAELLQHSADSMLAMRDAERCRRDGYDDIAIDFVAVSTRATLTHAGTKRLHTGDMVVVDCAQPVEINRSKHKVISLFIPRARVRHAVGNPAVLAGQLLPRQGLAALLRQHMLTTMEQAVHLLPVQRVMAINAAADMALSILQIQAGGRLDADQFATGTYHAALALIERECINPELTPQHIAASLGCSRAALYRAFAKEGMSVAAAIWTARLTHATRMLQATACSNLLISEIAFRSGFADHSTFDRMFKRMYDMTPGDMRNGIGVG